MGLGAYLDVLQGYTLGAVDHDALLGIVHLHVLDADVLHWHLWQTVEVGCTAGTTADYMVDVDVAEGWSCFIHLLHIYQLLLLLVAVVQYFHSRLAAVIEVEGNHVGLDIKHRHILDVDILYYTTTTAGTLETETYIGAEELAVAHLDILYATTHLAANNETTMPLEYGTAVYDDILARNAALSSVSILTALDTDTVIAYIESRIDDKCILAALQVKTITILSI